MDSGARAVAQRGKLLAFEPGKIVGYERNVNTLEELNNDGYEIIRSTDVTEGRVKIGDYAKCVVTIPGSELARGGGGARCMTMPVKGAGKLLKTNNSIQMLFCTNSAN